jgi:hypothetical protein
MAECPRCDQRLFPNATSCACGWRSRRPQQNDADPPRERVQCAHATCTIPAACKVKTRTGWANFCLPHYERYHEDIALAGLAEKGLERLHDETKAEHVERLRAWFKKNAKLKRFAHATTPDAELLEDEWANA